MKKKLGIWDYIKKDYLLYLMLILPVAFYITFCYVPMYGIVIAFKDYNIFSGIFGSEWIGFDVFKEIFKMSEFTRSLRNTLVLNLINLFLGFPIPIILAILLNEIRNDLFKRSLQTLLYLPYFLSWVIISGIAYQLFSTSTGVINQIIKNVGGSPIPFLTDNGWWIFTYFITHVWQSSGWGAIIYLAAITGISPELYEAARVDGCNRFRMMWNITLPSIRSTVVVMLILNLGKIVTIGFDQPFTMGNAMVQNVSDVISTFVYRMGIQNGEFSFATAVGLFQAVVSLVMIFLSNFFAKKMGEDGIW